MFSVKNRRNRTYFVGRRNKGDQEMAEFFYSVPVSPREKKRSRLTIKVGGRRIDLNGREINTLRSILGRALLLQTPSK